MSDIQPIFKDETIIAWFEAFVVSIGPIPYEKRNMLTIIRDRLLDAKDERGAFQEMEFQIKEYKEKEEWFEKEIDKRDKVLASIDYTLESL